MNGAFVGDLQKALTLVFIERAGEADLPLNPLAPVILCFAAAAVVGV